MGLADRKFLDNFLMFFDFEQGFHVVKNDVKENVFEFQHVNFIISHGDLLISRFIAETHTSFGLGFSDLVLHLFCPFVEDFQVLVQLVDALTDFEIHRLPYCHCRLFVPFNSDDGIVDLFCGFRQKEG